MQNPTVFLRTNMLTDVRIHMYSDCGLTIKMELYEISDGYRYNSVANTGTYSPLKMGIYLE